MVPKQPNGAMQVASFFQYVPKFDNEGPKLAE